MSQINDLLAEVQHWRRCYRLSVERRSELEISLAAAVLRADTLQRELTLLTKLSLVQPARRGSLDTPE